MGLCSIKWKPFQQTQVTCANIVNLVLSQCSYNGHVHLFCLISLCWLPCDKMNYVTLLFYLSSIGGFRSNPSRSISSIILGLLIPKNMYARAYW